MTIICNLKYYSLNPHLLIYSQFSRGRCLVIQASKCPFGFQRPVGNGNREPLLDSTNVAMTSPPITSPYAPAPSAEAPDAVNLGPGAILNPP